MIDLIRGEAIKLRSTRTAIGFLVAGVALILLLVVVTALADDPVSVSNKRDAMTVGPVFILFVVFGVVGATGEYRHRTVAPAVLIAPDRLRLLAARMLAYAVTAAGVAAAMLTLSLVLGAILMSGEPLAFGDYADLVGGGLLTAALAATLGVGFGALLGNQVAGVVTVLIYIFVVDSLIGLAKHALLPYSLGTAAGSLAGLSGSEAFGFLGSLAVVAGWALVFVAAGMARERRREVV